MEVERDAELSGLSPSLPSSGPRTPSSRSYFPLCSLKVCSIPCSFRAGQNDKQLYNIIKIVNKSNDIVTVIEGNTMM
ncbi:hypothetical protein P154DRAFT_521062 [Amniculicola lignicola CBS 123094]|uniref:Uncharacterized protein n=1 Tax=Amniculicola lignicola CBS 123094 TaxID=1392246 RepID=A0A6A5WPW9_9PLEO|nr:hypothetical protein P154DRAFT_521062 [Amniculicola lignicola CBS 123094]